MASSQSPSRPPPGNRVCVVGAGPVGLVSIKNLTEQGLEVTAFERDGDVGGTWLPSDMADKPTALPSTSFMIGKHGLSFTDFPMGQDYPARVTQKHMIRYLRQYASHFQLEQYVTFHTAVTNICRDDKDTIWLVKTRHMQTGEQGEHAFDRVVVAGGPLGPKRMRHVDGLDLFAGTVLHSSEVRGTEQYRGKNVLVVGGGPSAVDHVEWLHRSGAATIYISHSGKFRFTPEWARGQLWDDYLTYRAEMMVYFLASISQLLTFYLFDLLSSLVVRLMYPDLPHWSSFFENIPTTSRLPHVILFVNNYFISMVERGQVEIKSALRKLTGPRSAVLVNGEKLEDLDHVILCTGFYDGSMPLSGSGVPLDPALSPERAEKMREAPYSDPLKPFTRLYHCILSETWPESLACPGRSISLRGLNFVNDVATMALASLWSGKHPLPDRREMKRRIDKEHDFAISVVQRGPISHTGATIDLREPLRWYNEVAGTGINERLGSWALQGWQFWWMERRLYGTIMDGVFCPAMYRLFDSGKGRKAWPGARRAIEQVQEDAKRTREAWKQKVKEEAQEQGRGIFSLSHWK